jgi:ADP-heptose:LPS heptosyltransferase
VLVLRPGALGDTLLALPALRALRRAQLHVTLAAHAGAARLLAATNEVHAGLAFDDPSLGWLFRPDSGVPDEVVAWTSTTSLPALQHAKVVAPSRPPTMDRHCARYLLETLAPLGIDLTWDDHPLRIGPISSTEVLIHPGSGSPAKNWPADRFASLIRVLDAPVRLVVGEADASCAARVEACLGYAVPRLEQPPLEELARRLAGCRGYLGNDSGVSHLAGLCGARTIAIFGPSDPRVWQPIGRDVHVVTFDADPNAIAELVAA